VMIAERAHPTLLDPVTDRTCLSLSGEERRGASKAWPAVAGKLAGRRWMPAILQIVVSPAETHHAAMV
jgi:hypothetical protein